MRVALFSDTHLEFWKYAGFKAIELKILALKDKGVDVLVNCGDTHHDEGVQLDLEDAASRAGVKYVLVYGNHDYYGKFFPKVHHASTHGVLHGTLWTNFRGNIRDSERYLSYLADYQYVLSSVPDTGLDIHPLSRDMERSFYDFIEAFEKSAHEIVATHFAPCLGSLHPKYVGNWQTEILNPYFVNDLEKTILSHPKPPKLWLHGHVHDSFDYVVGKTRVVCNPMGYPRENFKDPNDYEIKIIEI